MDSQKGKIEIPLPMDEKNFRIGFVADYSSDLSQMYEIQYELDLKKGTISWETSRDIEPGDQYKFVIEFYIDAIKANGNSKSLDYTFKSFADITMVNLTVMEPMITSNFLSWLSPSASLSSVSVIANSLRLRQVSIAPAHKIEMPPFST